MTQRAMPAVTYLLAGFPKPDGPKRKDQTKRDTLVLQVGGLGVGLAARICKKKSNNCLWKQKGRAGRITDDDKYLQNS